MIVLRVIVPVPMVGLAMTGTVGTIGGMGGADSVRSIPVVVSKVAVAYYSSLTTMNKRPVSQSPRDKMTELALLMSLFCKSVILM